MTREACHPREGGDPVARHCEEERSDDVAI